MPVQRMLNLEYDHIGKHRKIGQGLRLTYRFYEVQKTTDDHISDVFSREKLSNQPLDSDYLEFSRDKSPLDRYIFSYFA